jgi:hypothetical protein
MQPTGTGALMSILGRAPARRRPRLAFFVGLLLLVGQLALGLHQFQHHLHPDFDTDSDGCSYCQFAAAMDSGIAPPVLEPPRFVLLTAVAMPAAAGFQEVLPRTDFQPRAPPLSLSA